MTAFKCAICSNTSMAEKISFIEYEVRVCDKCKYGIVWPLPTQEKLDELYNSKEYFANHMQYDFNTIEDAEIRKHIEKNKVLHGGHLKSYLSGDSKKILEVGSGGGFALKAFKELGHHVVGIETSKSAAAFCREKMEVQVIESSIENVQIDEKFDIIMLNHVLEHFLDVNAAMKKLVYYLRPSGVLYIRVPDHESYDRRKYAKEWPAYAYYHISNFSENSLARLFQRNGLSVQIVKYFMSEKAPGLIRKIARGPLRSRLVKRYNGRTITIIGKKI
jgi:2-polyprenyl-3-methyl-5-hydroxy-6-metoxy-1,4-benzoquinol methylase